MCCLQELARRLSKSAPMHKVQDLQKAIAQQEKDLQGLTGEAREVRRDFLSLEQCVGVMSNQFIFG